MDVDAVSVIPWLLSGDISIEYQTQRDLLDAPAERLKEYRNRIASEGWGGRILEKRDTDKGLWGNGYYSPKWISTHYTLLELKNMGISPETPAYLQSSELLLKRMWQDEAKKRAKNPSDLCVAAMVLSICCYTKMQSQKLFEIIDYLLDKQYPDGGWNCHWTKGDTHSSLHTTLSVLEAFRDYQNNGYSYRLEEIKSRVPEAWAFILKKKLFRAVHSGEIIDAKMLMLSYPCRWKYDILRCMDYFAEVKAPYDDRMDEAIDSIVAKKRKTNHWPVQQKYAGLIHFEMEKTGSDSRWNTLRVLRVLRFYRPELYKKILSD